MSKIKQAITDEYGELTKTIRLIEPPKVDTTKAAQSVAKGIKATGKGTVFVAAKTIRTGRGLAKAFAGFYEEVRVEMCKQDAKARQ